MVVGTDGIDDWVVEEVEAFLDLRGLLDEPFVVEVLVEAVVDRFFFRSISRRAAAWALFTSESAA